MNALTSLDDFTGAMSVNSAAEMLADLERLLQKHFSDPAIRASLKEVSYLRTGSLQHILRSFFLQATSAEEVSYTTAISAPDTLRATEHIFMAEPGEGVLGVPLPRAATMVGTRLLQAAHPLVAALSAEVLTSAKLHALHPAETQQRRVGTVRLSVRLSDQRTIDLTSFSHLPNRTEAKPPIRLQGPSTPPAELGINTEVAAG